jgi:hypothetical protein
MKERHGSWLSLVSFCAVMALTAALGFGVLFAGVSVAFAVAQSSQTSGERQPEITAQTSPTPDDKLAQAVAFQPRSNTRSIDDGGTAATKTFAGMITDSRCGARHSKDSGKTSAECARACVRNGSHYVLVDGEKVYALEGGLTQIENLAGERAEVVGMLEGDTIRVKAVGSR